MSKDFNKNKKNNTNDKRWNNRRSGKDANKNRCMDKETRDLDQMIDRQDPFWYAQDQKAIENMASFPWNNIVGDPFPGVTYSDNKDKTPAIVVYPVWHIIGSGDSSRSNYLTRAADSYYQYVTQGFTGGVNFEAPDLLFTALAAQSLLAVMLEGKRAYGMMKYYLQHNKYYARTMLNALGFNYDSFNSSMATFRTQYNIRVAQLNKIIAVPKSFFVGDRWEFMTSWVFTDTDSPEYSTAYAYTIAAALKYEATASTTGTSLSWAMKDSDSMTVSQFFSYVDSLINALIDSDARDVFGAVRRVYDDSMLKHLSELDEDFTTTIVRNDVVAMAIHNTMPLGQFRSNVLGAGSQTKQLIMTQTTDGAIVSNVYGNYMGGSAIVGEETLPCSYEPEHVILDLYDHLVTPANVLDATANMTALDYSDKLLGEVGGPVLCKVICRSEIVSLPRIYAINEDTQGTTAIYAPIYCTNASFRFAANSNGVNWASPDAIRRISSFSHLDSHTLIRVMGLPVKETENIDDKGTVVFKFKGVFTYIGEIDRYTGISITDLIRMHEQSQYQLLSMPSNSKSVTK